MRYPARIKPDEDTWMVSFRDLPGVFSQGDSFEEARAHAVDALETGLYFAARDGDAIFAASAPRRGEVLIETSISFDAKLLLLETMRGQNVRAKDLAVRLGITPQEVTRLIDLRHRTKIDAIAAALNALGKRLELSLAA